MSPLRFGLLACSSVARRRFVPAIGRSDGAGALEFVGSRDPEVARVFAAEVGAPRWGTYEDVLNDPNVDCVYISTAPSVHEHWSIEAARKGKHVLCEKPSALSLAGANAVAEACRSNDVAFLEGYMYRFHPQHHQVLRMLRAGDIGRPAVVTARFTYPRPPDNDIRMDADLAGGAFFDSAGYLVSAALMLIEDRPEHVTARILREPDSRVDRAAAMLITFRGGATAQLFAGFDLQYRSRYSVLGSSGRIEVERAFSVSHDHEPIIVVERGLDESYVRIAPTDQFARMIESFSTAVHDPSQRALFVTQSLQQHAVMDAAQRSSKAGSTVEIEGWEE